MAINNPAQPSTNNLATTTNESRGGLFTDTNGVGIDLSSVAGPAGMDGRGIATITASPTDPALGDPVTVTVTYTDGSTPTSFTVAAGERGLTGAQGASVIPIFFQIAATDPTTGLPTDIRDITENLLEADTHYAFVRTDDSIIFQDGTLSLSAFALQIEQGRLGYHRLSEGQDGDHGISFVDIFFTGEFNALGFPTNVLNASTTFDRDSTGASVTHTSRAFVRSDNTRYFNDNDVDSFNANSNLRTDFRGDVLNGTLSTSLLQGPQGEDGPRGPEGRHVVRGELNLAGTSLTLVLSDGTSVQAPGTYRGSEGEDGLSIVNLYVEQYTSLIGTILYRNVSTVIADHHNFFAPVRSNNDLVFPNGYDITSDAEQWTQNLTAFDNLLRNNDIELHRLGGIGPDGPQGQPGDTGPRGPTGARGDQGIHCLLYTSPSPRES